MNAAAKAPPMWLPPTPDPWDLALGVALALAVAWCVW